MTYYSSSPNTECHICGNLIAAEVAQVLPHGVICDTCMLRGSDRRCDYCGTRLPIGWPAVYCSNSCAEADY